MHKTCEKYRSHLTGLVEGTLEERAAAELRAHISACAPCRGEYEWLLTLVADLEALGAAAVTRTPQIDLVDAVKEAVAKTASGARRVRLVRPTRAKYLGWVGLAAAAGLVLAVWFGVGVFSKSLAPAPTAPIAKSVRRVPPRPPAPEKPRAAAPDKQMKAGKDSLEKALAQFAETYGSPSSHQEGPERTVAPDWSSLTLEDIVAARRQASSDDNARARLERWASLTAESAQEVLGRVEPGSDASIGASEALTPAEARPHLLDAIGDHPNDPYLRLALLETYHAQGDSIEEAIAQAVELEQLDPENASPYYLEALLQFGRANSEGALAALAQAQELERATVYPLEAARYHVQALIETGMDPLVARLLTAFTAGTDEYGFLTQLGSNLSQHGQELMLNGDLETARDVFEAIQQLGAQVDEGAAFAQERLAALDIQRTAIDGLSEVYKAKGLPEDVDGLVGQVHGLMSSLESVRDFLAQLDALLSEDEDPGYLETVANGILQVGDLIIFEFLHLLGG